MPSGFSIPVSEQRFFLRQALRDKFHYIVANYVGGVFDGSPQRKWTINVHIDCQANIFVSVMVWHAERNYGEKVQRLMGLLEPLQKYICQLNIFVQTGFLE